jgi:hypothetical protein
VACATSASFLNDVTNLFPTALCLHTEELSRNIIFSVVCMSPPVRKVASPSSGMKNTHAFPTIYNHRVLMRVVVVGTKTFPDAGKSSQQSLTLVLHSPLRNGSGEDLKPPLLTICDHTCIML